MKIAILGTRGIPNNYGGFEQLAEYLSLGLVQKGHEVYVYSSSKHSYQEKTWKGVHILHQSDPEKSIGTVGQFIYDLNCILDSRKRGFDSILNLGYTSSSVWMRLFSGKTRIITNMDGLEWKRTKYSKKVQRFLMMAEKWAVKRSHALVADSLAIQDYLLKKYEAPSHFIAYGAHLFNTPNEAVLEPYGLLPNTYNMLIARMEPENNIEMILDGVVQSNSTLPFYVVGNANNKFGLYLQEKFKPDKRIVFAGPIYGIESVNNLRYYCNLYFHGHSVGGTNPSLLEAMASKTLIAAHANEFNKSVLGSDAYYFTSAAEVANLLGSTDKQAAASQAFLHNNFEKIRSLYSWDKIVSAYEQVMIQA